jgi:tagaturonate reductase
MQLSKDALGKIAAQPGLTIPDSKLLELPEKVLQFGTGVLLRGLPDYFIDKANRQGVIALHLINKMDFIQSVFVA